MTMRRCNGKWRLKNERKQPQADFALYLKIGSCVLSFFTTIWQFAKAWRN